MKPFKAFIIIILLIMAPASAAPPAWQMSTFDPAQDMYDYTPFWPAVYAVEMPSGYAPTAGSCAAGATIVECAQHFQHSISSLGTAVSGKEPAISAAAADKYLRGDKTWVTFPDLFSGSYADLTNKPGAATISAAGFMSAADKLKLDGVASGATVNSTDSALLSRSNHTGSQAISTVTGLQSALDAKQVELVSGTSIRTVEGQALLGPGNVDLTKSDVGLASVDNTSDAAKPVSSPQQVAIDAKVDNSLTASTTIAPSKTAVAAGLALRPTVYLGSTVKTGVKMLAGQVITTGGVATYYLTDTGGAGGSALFANVYGETLDFEVNDSVNSYRYSWSLSGDRKTLTVTVTRSAPTGLIALLGLNLTSAPVPTPNGTAVRMTVWGD